MKSKGRSGQDCSTQAQRLHGNLMSLVGAGHGPVDELGSLNEQPDHSAKIGDHYREALAAEAA